MAAWAEATEVADVFPNAGGIGVRRPGVGTAIRLSGIVDQSIVDGPGLRLTVFTQGCPHHCPGCHNPGTHAFGEGFGAEAAEILARFDDNPLLAGITLSGGEPLVQAEALLPLARQIGSRGKTVWCYTGYTFEEALAAARGNPSLAALLRHIDVLVDGRYEAARRSLILRYRGSANQRVLDLPASLAAGEAVPWRLR